MSVNQTHVDPIPEEFDSYESIAHFWDTHDTTDYPDAFETVQVEAVDIQNRRFEVEVKADLMGALAEQAQQQGIAVGQLVDSLLRQNLSDVA